MGCSVSRPITVSSEDHSPSCSHSSSPVPRALSIPMPLVHHLPTKKGDTHHLVSLTSTSYGFLLMTNNPSDQKDLKLSCHGGPLSPPNLAKSFQDDKVNQTKQEQSLSPDSVINTWELMDGLDDDGGNIIKPNKSNVDTPMDASKKPNSCNTTFDGSANKLLDSFDELKPSETVMEENFSSPSSLTGKPLWQQLSEEALFAKLDPNVVLSYRRALSSRQFGRNLSKGVRSMGSSPLNCSSFSNNLCSLPCAEDRIVVYFTSLRGIRKTYEDCCSVRMILRGFRVVVDEKDISMDSSYRKELQNALGISKAMTLPQVFIKGKYVGNAEEIKHLNESGELANLLKGFPIKDPGFVCEGCGDARFVPCPNCNGSRKVFEQEERELRRCPDCNENGLIKCPGCCS